MSWFQSIFQAVKNPVEWWMQGTSAFPTLNEEERKQFEELLKPVVKVEKPASYKAIKKLGEGAYGTVWMVEGSDGKMYAKKKFLLEKAAVFNEIDLSCRLDHPNIISAIDCSIGGGFVRLYLPLADGGDLLHFIQDHKSLTIQKLVYMMYELASAVAFLHSLGYYHCDIKPENILMFGSTPKVSDLGLAFPLEYDQAYCGTPTWTSPQGLSKSSWPGVDISQEKLNHISADLYSLGTTFFYMLTKTKLIKAWNSLGAIQHGYDVSQQKIEKLIATLHPLNDHIMIQLLVMIQKMTNPSQTKRYEQVKDILKEAPFSTFVYTTPIPGNVKISQINMVASCMQKIPMYSKNVSQIFGKIADWIVDVALIPKQANGLVACISLSLFLRCASLIPSKDMIQCYAAACLYVANRYIGDKSFTLDAAASYTANQYYPTQIEAALGDIIKHVDGIIRIPTIYDFALTADEIKWALQQYVKDCNTLSIEPKQLHEKYVNQVETSIQKLSKRAPKTDPIPWPTTATSA